MGDHSADEREPTPDNERGGFSRRGLLIGAAGLTGVAVSGVWKGTVARAADASAAASRATPPGGFVFLELNGKLVGTVKLVDGGTAFAEAVEEPAGDDGIVRKHIGNPKYEEFTVKLGLGMGKPVYDWISSSIARKGRPLNGAFIGVDSGLKVRRRTDFSNALISELGFPVSDASSKDPAFMTLKFSPETTRSKAGDGSAIGARPSNQKQWLPSNFRLTIEGLDTKAVSKVEAYPVKWESQSAGVIEPSKVEYPNFFVTLPESHAQSWHDWFDDFVIKGNNGQESELVGLLEWPTPDLSKVLASVDIKQLGILRLAPDKPEPIGSDDIRRVKVEMYCEEITFNYKAGWA